MSTFGLFGNRAHASAESDFWKRFQQNEVELFDFERDQEAIFDQLTVEMRKVHPSLTFEFGPKENGGREFVISADGNKDAFPKVESLLRPRNGALDSHQFRPRREPFDITYAAVSVKADTILVFSSRMARRSD